MADNNIEVKLKGKRLSFFHGFKPQERRDDKTKELTGYNFNTAILLDKLKDEEDIEAVKDAMRRARQGKWGETAPRIPPERYCLRDGEPIDPDTGKPVPLYDGYAGCMFLTANRTVSVEDYDLIKKGLKPNPVTIIGPRKGSDGRFAKLTENDQFAPYSGCYANSIVRIYGFASNDFPARINASLEAVQFAKHGEPFSSKPIDADSAFDEVEGEDDMEGPATGGASAGADLLG